METTNQGEIAQLTADIVSAFVTNNKVERGQLSKLIEDVRYRQRVERRPDRDAS